MARIGFLIDRTHPFLIRRLWSSHHHRRRHLFRPWCYQCCWSSSACVYCSKLVDTIVDVSEGRRICAVWLHHLPSPSSRRAVELFGKKLLICAFVRLRWRFGPSTVSTKTTSTSATSALRGYSFDREGMSPLFSNLSVRVATAMIGWRC